MLPMTFALSIFAVAADPGASPEPQPPPEPSLSTPLEWVQQCLSDATKTAAVNNCKGRWSNLCQKHPQRATTVGITSCIAEELSAWESLLAELYTKLEVAAQDYDLYMPEGVSVQKSLAASKSAWVAFRDAQCDYEYNEYADGTMRGIVGVDCVLSLTVQRYAYLLEHGRQQNHFE